MFGPNGAGKTTLLKIITGLSRAGKGSVRLFGHGIDTEYEKAMERVGCIIETAECYEYLSAYHNLKLAASFYPQVTEKRIEEALELVGLLTYRKEMAKQFSSGMKQRLALAGALLSNPELVIRDEPTTGLDIEGMVDFRRLIGQLAAEREITFLISSHMINEMELMCNRIGIIYNGKLISQGLARELLAGQTSLEQYYIDRIQQARGGHGYE